MECVESSPKRCSAGLLWPVKTQNRAVSTLPGSREADGFQKEDATQPRGSTLSHCSLSQCSQPFIHSLVIW